MRFEFDWTDVAFKDKEPLNILEATFIAAPRELSVSRFKDLIKKYLPKGNIVLGLSKERYVEGFEGQFQFRMLDSQKVQSIITLTNSRSEQRKIYTLSYFQRELPYILQKLDFKRVVLIHGSWRHVFHTLPSYYVLAEKGTPYKMESPFTGIAEAQEYEESCRQEMRQWLLQYYSGTFTDAGMLDIANKVARLSFDHSFQTGASLGKRISARSKKYNLLTSAFNKVVPFQTYALLHGSSREKHFSPTHDLNHYDTVHAEVELIIAAQKLKIDLKGTTMFINLMPCPSCARMLSETDIEEFVYSIDHSDGYAVKMLEAAGKKVRRVVA